MATHSDQTTANLQQVPTTRPASYTTLSGLSCRYSRVCTAVGTYHKPGTGLRQHPVAEHE